MTLWILSGFKGSHTQIPSAQETDVNQHKLRKAVGGGGRHMNARCFRENVPESPYCILLCKAWSCSEEPTEGGVISVPNVWVAGAIRQKPIDVTAVEENKTKFREVLTDIRP